MFALITATEIETLASRLATGILQERRDPFCAPRVLAPDFCIKQWLTLQLASWVPGPGAKGIAINIDIQFIEAGLWEALVQVDPELARNPKPRTDIQFASQIGVSPFWDCGHLAGGAKELPERLTREFSQWMILSTLLAEARGKESGKAFAPLLNYLQIPSSSENEKQGGASWNRRLWQLADKLARLFHEYEQEQPAMIKEWLEAPPAKNAPEMARCQRTLYRRLFAPGGVQERLARQSGRLCLSLPQYFRRIFGGTRAPAGPMPELHVFTLPQLPPGQYEMLKALSGLGNVKVYDLAVPRECCKLRKRWGQVEQAKQALLAEPNLAAEELPEKNSAANSILGCLQMHLRKASGSPRAPQDRSLQIVACPSIRREVEMAYNSIIANMLENTEKSLKLSDIAILIPDMAAYKPVLESVFARSPGLLAYNLVDSTAAADSVYAQAVSALLALGEDGFTRREVFELILNPCFLARLGMAREEAEVWLQWADKLNIFRGFKAVPGSVFSWQHGLRRLRLGRIMETPPDRLQTGNFPAYHELAPYADMDSQEPFEVGRFSETMEALAEAVERLREGAPRSCAHWAALLREHFDRFLEIPPDRPEEEPVRAALRAALEKFSSWDAAAAVCAAAAGAQGIGPGLELLREFVRDNLGAIPSRKGHYLLDGVTISALSPGRPVPFKIIYVLGLGAGKFPGEKNRTALDLSAQASAGHEAARQAFGETILAARQKLYLSYVCQDLQKQVEFQPCTLVNELRGYVEENFLAEKAEFKTAVIPLKGSSRKYIEARHADTWTDLPGRNFSSQDVLVALNEHLAELEAAGKKGRGCVERVRNMRRELARQFAPPAVAQISSLPSAGKMPAAPEGTDTNLRSKLAVCPGLFTGKMPAAPSAERVELRELERFLLNPAEATLRRQFKFFDEEDEDSALAEDEPFAGAQLFNNEIIKAVETYCVETQAGQKNPETMQSAALEFLGAYYEDAHRRGRAPAGAFKALDRNALAATAREVLAPGAPDSGLAGWLSQCVEAPRQIIIGQPQGGVRIAAVKRETLPPLTLSGTAGFPPATQSPGQTANLLRKLVSVPSWAASIPPATPSSVCFRIELHGEFSYLSRNVRDGFWEFVVLAGTAKQPDKGVGKKILPAWLCYLALRALDFGPFVSKSGAGSGWRALVFYKDGLRKWEYGHFSREQAAEYLAGLARDCLSLECAMLPFEIISHDDFLREACQTGGKADSQKRQEYAARLAEAIEKDRESLHQKYRRPEYLDLISFAAPENAYQSVQERLAPLFAHKEHA